MNGLKVTAMALPPLYKYLDVQGAKLTLGNNTFRHAKPSTFNDVEDLAIKSIFPEEIDAALEKLASGFIDVILANLDEKPTCSEALAKKVAELQKIFKANPKAAEIVREEIRKTKLYDVDYWRERSKAFVEEINAFMQRYRVLCVTTKKDSEQMWEGYAEKHKGTVLRIVPNIEKDSKFQKFAPVHYHKERPSLYDNTMDFAKGSLFGDQEATKRAMLDKTIYSKTLKWKHENEYRLAIPLAEGEEDWTTLPYHPEEITELYLGMATTPENKAEIVGKAKALNPRIAVFQARRVGKDGFAFDAV
jgi:Protein of unknown function (DUF2971)